ncbi:MAG: ABC transporter permease [Canibacter sp.]
MSTTKQPNLHSDNQDVAPVRAHTLTKNLLISVACVVVMCLFMIAMFIPSLFAPGDPLATSAAEALQPPSLDHWFGTDQVGRDVYTRVIHGTASTLGSGLIATVGAAVIGGVLGSLSAFGPTWERSAVLRLTEVGLAIPEFLLALLILAFIGTGTVAVTVAVGVAAIPAYARVAALSARTVIGSEAVEAARILGVHWFRIVWRHVLPVALRPVVALAVLGVATAMLAIAGLTFLGLGVQPPNADWGLMMSQGKAVVRRAWWVVVLPGLALGLAAATFTVGSRLLQSRGRRAE